MADPFSYSAPPTLNIGGSGVVLRALRRRDRRAWNTMLATCKQWLRPWEPTTPEQPQQTLAHLHFAATYAMGKDRWRDRSGMFWVLADERGQILGRFVLGGITGGAARGASIGYFVAPAAAGRGLAPAACATILDYAFTHTPLHRIEICIRPENHPSLRVAQKLGLPEEGVRRQFLHIDGAWRDHRVFVAIREEWSCGRDFPVADTPSHRPGGLGNQPYR